MARKTKKAKDAKRRPPLFNRPEKFISKVVAILPQLIDARTGVLTICTSSIKQDRAVLNPFYNPLNKGSLVSYLINGGFAKGGQMEKKSIVLIKKEITAKFLNDKRQGASDEPVCSLFALAVEAEKTSEKGEVQC